MGRTVWMSWWVWIVLDPGVCSVSLPEITDKKFIDECVTEHNKARSSVSPAADDMLYMTWDEGLAITARAWARHCLFEHNIYLKDARRVHPTFPSVGENLWAGYPPSNFKVTSAIKKWVDEKEQYNIHSHDCSGVCGHYKQVVWASSYKVGCAVQLCPNGVKETTFNTEEGAIFVCNYAPAGNMVGMRPYGFQGQACSKCKSTCVENLCRDPKRDSQISYDWTPDWDPVQTKNLPGGANSVAGGSSYVPILVVRPIALVLTFVAAYTVHHFYPDIFFYE